MNRLPVSLVVSTEGSGIDRYSQELAKRLPVSTVPTGRYHSVRQGLRLARQLRPLGHLIHMPNQHFARWLLWLKQPGIVTVHDLVRLAFPYAKESWTSAMGLALDRRGIQKAVHVICVSEATKRDLIRHLGIREESVTVIYNGVDHAVFRPRPERDGSRFQPPYLLYVGSERPRKNLKVLLRAFSVIKKMGSAFDSLKVFKVGPAGRSPAFRKATLQEAHHLGIEGDIHFIEHLSDQELAVAYSNAIALVFPSLYEGFGLPIVEAMACGCPVITSNVSSLPEIARSAALLVDPNDTAALAEAMRRVIVDRETRARLHARGLLRAREFSWEKTAEATLALYERILARPQSGLTLDDAAPR